eukprot:snap_masked-scaffold_8-processed-gene-6.34-mRNA-1 protein AED:0.10 eAED:1.00 QI:0/0/0/1/1/1/2/0/361
MSQKGSSVENFLKPPRKGSSRLTNIKETMRQVKFQVSSGYRPNNRNGSTFSSLSTSVRGGGDPSPQSVGYANSSVISRSGEGSKRYVHKAGARAPQGKRSLISAVGKYFSKKSEERESFCGCHFFVDSPKVISLFSDGELVTDSSLVHLYKTSENQRKTPGISPNKYKIRCVEVSSGLLKSKYDETNIEAYIVDIKDQIYLANLIEVKVDRSNNLMLTGYGFDPKQGVHSQGKLSTYCLKFKSRNKVLHWFNLVLTQVRNICGGIEKIIDYLKGVYHLPNLSTSSVFNDLEENKDITMKNHLLCLTRKRYDLLKILAKYSDHVINGPSTFNVNNRLLNAKKEFTGLRTHRDTFKVDNRFQI